jgi:rare lipoprotein A
VARATINALTAAHNHLRHPGQGHRRQSKRSAIVVINDRGPTTAGRIIDLSSAAARKIGMSRPGLRQVTLEVLSQPAAKTRKAAKQ